MSYNDDTLKTITIAPDSTGEKFIVPDCRMTSADQTANFVRRLLENDTQRSFKRSKVDGLVGGNPPYNNAKLAQAARRDACNVNWGTAASYCEQASGAFYDLTSEAPAFFSFRTGFGNADQREMWSNLAAKFADTLLSKIRAWDYNVQLSQWDMVLHGCGPFFFENEWNFTPRAVRCGRLQVPEFTPSDTEYWDASVVQVDYYPTELFEFIDNPEAANRGWNVDYTKRVISNAMSPTQQRSIPYNWEFFEQQCKNNSLNYMYSDGRMNRLAYVFWQEFDGRITQAIVERDTATGSYAGSDDAKMQYGKNEDGTLKASGIQYLYLKVGKYANWEEALHPMYYDHGNGGYHHSVTGLGVKMYSAMEYENRLLCRLADDAFAPKILFAPTTEAAKQKFELTHLGPYGVLPAGMTMNQSPVGGMMQDGLAMRQTIKTQMSERLSTYRGGVPDQKQGNPRTMYEMQLSAQAQGAINKTQFNRYYNQWDCLAKEMWRRLTTPGSSDKHAKMFRDLCKEAQIPPEVFQDKYVEHVGVTRVVGQGSAFMRSQSITNLLGIAGSLPEDGRSNLIRDKIASEAGQSAVPRYFPDKPVNNIQTDQQAEALQWVACMKVGVPAVVTSTQNPVTYAATFLKAATDSLQSLQQGGNPAEVLQFLHTIGPCIIAQLQRFATDKTRKPVFDTIMAQWKQLAAATDKLQAVVDQQAQQQQSQQAKTQAAMTDQQLKAQATQASIADKNAKTAAQIQQSAAKHEQQLRHKEESAALQRQQALQSMQLEQQEAQQTLATSDASTASDIHLSRAETIAKIQNDRAKAEAAANKPKPKSA